MDNDHFRSLLEYKNTFGNTNVPRSYVAENGLKLGDWVHRLRLRKKGTKGSKLTEEEIAELDAVGFVWNLGARPDASVFEGLLRISQKMYQELPPDSKLRSEYEHFVQEYCKCLPKTER